MLKKRNFLLGALISALAIVGTAAPSFAENITIEHVSGKTDVPLNPKRVVVFDLATLDNLNCLGIDPVIGVPESPRPAYLARFADAKYAKVGTLFEPDYEAVAALNPDLIIIAGRSQPKYKELAKIAPTIDLTVNDASYLADVDRNVTLLGQIFSKQDVAKAEIEKLNNAIDAVKKEASGKGNGLLILTTGGKMSAFGPGSRFGLIHSGFGIIPAAKDLTVGKHGQPISAEYILETNPDWLFVIDRDAAIGRKGEAAAQLLDNPVVNKITAAKKGQIIYLDPQNWYLVGGGLSGLHETAEQIMAAYKKADAK